MTQIAELAKSKTVILISHRLANVVDADNIYVMQDGNTVESGTHTELLKTTVFMPSFIIHRFSLKTTQRRCE